MICAATKYLQARAHAHEMADTNTARSTRLSLIRVSLRSKSLSDPSLSLIRMAGSTPIHTRLNARGSSRTVLTGLVEGPLGVVKLLGTELGHQRPGSAGKVLEQRRVQMPSVGHRPGQRRHVMRAQVRQACAHAAAQRAQQLLTRLAEAAGPVCRARRVAPSPRMLVLRRGRRHISYLHARRRRLRALAGVALRCFFL